MLGIKPIFATFIFALSCLFSTQAFGQSEPGSEAWNYEVSKAIALSLSDTPAWEFAMPYLREIGPKTTDWNLLLFQAKVQQQRGDIEEADKSIKRALASNDKNPRIYALAGNIATDLGRQEDAVNYFANALKYQPDNAAVLLSLGRLRFARREWDQLIPLYEHLLRFVPPNSEICIRLATAYENVGNIENAEKYLRKNLSVHPNRLLALIPLERFYRKYNRIERANEVAAELRKLQYHDNERREMRALRPSSK